LVVQAAATTVSTASAVSFWMEAMDVCPFFLRAL
jgi:hypothetical protein